MRLGWLRTEMQTIYDEYPVSDRPLKEFHLRAIVRYFLVMRLHDFILVRKMLYPELMLLKKEQLDQTLKPYWEPIVKHEVAIAELRKSYIAHMQEKEAFERQIGDIIFERQYPHSHGDARFFAGCAWCYCYYVIKNFPVEYDRADKKYRAASPLELFTSHIKNEAGAKPAVGRLTKQVVEDLKAKGFNY